MKENVYTKNSIRTFTGLYFDLSIMDPETITIEDIAHGLAHTARFAGQLKNFYSVAQHSFCTYQNASPENKLAALLHDASEAYIGDMPSPFKCMMPDYKKIEYRLMETIACKFGFPFPLADEIKDIDRFMLQIEWNGLVEDKIPLKSWSPGKAKRKFLEAYYECIALKVIADAEKVES